MRCMSWVYYAVLTNDSAPPLGFTGRGAVGSAYGRRAWPLRLAWKSAIAFLILAWFSGLRASWITLAAMADVASFLIMPAMCGLLVVDYGLSARLDHESTVALVPTRR